MIEALKLDALLPLVTVMVVLGLIVWGLVWLAGRHRHVVILVLMAVAIWIGWLIVDAGAGWSNPRNYCGMAITLMALSFGLPAWWSSRKDAKEGPRRSPHRGTRLPRRD